MKETEMKVTGWTGLFEILDDDCFYHKRKVRRLPQWKKLK